MVTTYDTQQRTCLDPRGFIEIGGVSLMYNTYYTTVRQEGQHPLTGQRTANFRLSFQL